MHAAYWKYVVWRRLTGAARGSFAEHGSNWFERPTDLSTKAWQADVRALADAHRTLRAAIVNLDPRTLDRPLGRNSRTTLRALVTGVAAHDVYHAGQIQLLKRLY